MAFIRSCRDNVVFLKALAAVAVVVVVIDSRPHIPTHIRSKCFAHLICEAKYRSLLIIVEKRHIFISLHLWESEEKSCCLSKSENFQVPPYKNHSHKCITLAHFTIHIDREKRIVRPQMCARMCAQTHAHALIYTCVCACMLGAPHTTNGKKWRKNIARHIVKETMQSKHKLKNNITENQTNWKRFAVFARRKKKKETKHANAIRKSVSKRSDRIGNGIQVEHWNLLHSLSI